MVYPNDIHQALDVGKFLVFDPYAEQGALPSPVPAKIGSASVVNGRGRPPRKPANRSHDFHFGEKLPTPEKNVSRS